MDELVEMIKQKIFGGRIRTRLMIPYDKGSIVSYLCDNAAVSSINYEAEGTVIEGEFSTEDYGKYKEYEII